MHVLSWLANKWAALPVVAASTLCLWGAGASADPLKLDRSAVVAMVEVPPEIYKAAGVDFVVWAGHPNPPHLTIGQFRRNVSQARAIGVEVGGAIGTITSFAGFIKEASDAEREAAICRRCTGEPVVVPHLKNETYKGFPAYWFSVTSPAFRRFEKGVVNMTLDGGVRSLQIDDVSGAVQPATWNGGCFSAVDTEALRGLYVARIPGATAESFDLCRFQKRVTVPDTPERRIMLDHFTDAAIDNIREIKAVAKGRGLPMPVSGNIDLKRSYAGKFMAELDFYTFETSYGEHPEKLDSLGSIYSLKLGDHLGKPTILTAYGVNHTYVAEHKAYTLLRTWIARSYAFGGYYTLPLGVWMDRKIDGSDRLQLAPEEYVPLFRFIKDNGALFDGHEEVARVAILHDTRSLDAETGFDGNFGNSQPYRSAVALLKKGIPFSVIPVTGDDDVGRALAQLGTRYDYLVATKQLRERLAGRDLGGRVVYDPAEIPDTYAISLAAPGSRLQVSLRRAGAGDPRFVLHVLNLDYDPAADAVRPAVRLEVRIPRIYVDKTVQDVRVHALDAWGREPAGPPVTIAAREDSRNVTLTLDNVGAWSLLEF